MDLQLEGIWVVSVHWQGAREAQRGTSTQLQQHNTASITKTPCDRVLTQ
jgi:hypothetical protein